MDPKKRWKQHERVRRYQIESGSKERDFTRAAKEADAASEIIGKPTAQH